MFLPDINAYNEYLQLPLEEFDGLNRSVYVLDKDWNFLYINSAARQYFGPAADSLAGKNVLIEFPQIKADANFLQIKANCENGVSTDLVAISPFTNKRVKVVAHVLSDCLVFYSMVVPNKEELLTELRSELKDSRTTGNMPSQAPTE